MWEDLLGNCGNGPVWFMDQEQKRGVDQREAINQEIAVINWTGRDTEFVMIPSFCLHEQTGVLFFCKGVPLPEIRVFVLMFDGGKLA